MSIFSSCGILSESSDISSITESASEVYSEIESLEEGVFKYTPSMIPILAKRTSEGTKYLVEFDMLQKLAACNDVTLYEAFQSVCEDNGIEEDDAYVMAEDPEEDLEEKCCAEAVADVETSIAIENRIANKYNDIASLKENCVNILSTDQFLTESSVNPELKKMWKNYKDSPEEDCKTHFKILKNIYNSCESIGDYKYAYKLLDRFVNAWTGNDGSDSSSISQASSLKDKCQKKITDLTEENRQNKIAAKEYRRDQLAAKRAEKKKARAERRAAKASE